MAETTFYCWACGTGDEIPAVARCWGGESGTIKTDVHVCRNHMPLALIAGWKPAEYGSDLEKQYESEATHG